MIKKIWNWISDLGVSEKHPEENNLIRLFNRMSFLSAIAGLEIILGAIYTELHELYICINICVVTIYCSVLLANFYGKIYLARYFISVGSPLWISICHIALGGFFSQSLAIVTSMAITYIGFEKHKRLLKVLLAFHLIIFFGAVLYDAFYGSILPDFNFTFDEFVVFIASLGWMIIVLMHFNGEREQLIENLKKKNNELQDTTEELERFTYIASHDLKSPLRTITSFIGLIERDIKKENFEGLQDKLHFVKSGAEQMNFLVQDILELSTLKSLDKTARRNIDLDLILEKAKTNLMEEVAQSNAVIYAGDLPHFECNEVEFLLLFQNFIQNGIKYNHSEKPKVTISTFETDGTLRISFRDNGIGIAPEYHELIFQFFKRLHTADEYQGTGLGLGLCKKIINNYNGKVEVDSVLGEGTTFTLIFPVSEKSISFRETESLKELTTGITEN